jgi:hypothetical protein
VCPFVTNAQGLAAGGVAEGLRDPTLADPARPGQQQMMLSFAKTSSAFSFNNLGKPDITC